MAHVEAICIAQRDSAPMVSLQEVEASVGVGLARDRYAAGTGFYSKRPTDPGAREVTLFEAEVLDAVRTEAGLELNAQDHRRNLTVRGVRLNELLGQRFRIGSVVMEGVKDCPPCDHLEQVVGKPVLKPLLNRGGLRARVLQSGTMRVGDSIIEETPALLA